MDQRNFSDLDDVIINFLQAVPVNITVDWNSADFSSLFTNENAGRDGESE